MNKLLKHDVSMFAKIALVFCLFGLFHVFGVDWLNSVVAAISVMLLSVFNDGKNVRATQPIIAFLERYKILELCMGLSVLYSGYAQTPLARMIGFIVCGVSSVVWFVFMRDKKKQ